MRAPALVVVLVVVAASASACGGESASHAGPRSPAHAPPRAAGGAAHAPPQAVPSPPETEWAEATQSPRAVETATRDLREITLARACGKADASLDRVAADLAAMRAKGLGTADADAVVARLRAAGEPHTRPRVVVATGRAPLDEAAVRSALSASSSGSPAERAASARGVRRCAVAIAGAPDGSEVLVAIAVDALADLAPLPTRARTGEWLSFDARVHAPASRAKLVVLPPHGIPRTVPTSIDASGMARARFALDQPGGFTVQLVADLEEGPRPVLEARVFADVAPPAIGEELPAPGEDAASASSASPAEADALAQMIAALRASEGLSRLVRDARLDAFARAHAERMRDAGVAAHDLGDGDPRARFEAESTFPASAVGENVARATTVSRAHRALYASPSHRMNLLRADYTHVGVGVAVGRDGSVYACETFATKAGAAPR